MLSPAQGLLCTGMESTSLAAEWEVYMKKLLPIIPCLIDLHLHLDGSVSSANAKALAALQGIKVPEGKIASAQCQ